MSLLSKNIFEVILYFIEATCIFGYFMMWYYFLHFRSCDLGRQSNRNTRSEDARNIIHSKVSFISYHNGGTGALVCTARKQTVRNYEHIAIKSKNSFRRNQISNKHSFKFGETIIGSHRNFGPSLLKLVDITNAPYQSRLCGVVEAVGGLSNVTVKEHIKSSDSGKKPVTDGKFCKRIRANNEQNGALQFVSKSTECSVDDSVIIKRESDTQNQENTDRNNYLDKVATPMNRINPLEDCRIELTMASVGFTPECSVMYSYSNKVFLPPIITKIVAQPLTNHRKQSRNGKLKYCQINSLIFKFRRAIRKRKRRIRNRASKAFEGGGHDLNNLSPKSSFVSSIASDCRDSVSSLQRSFSEPTMCDSEKRTRIIPTSISLSLNFDSIGSESVESKNVKANSVNIEDQSGHLPSKSVQSEEVSFSKCSVNSLSSTSYKRDDLKYALLNNTSFLTRSNSTPASAVSSSMWDIDEEEVDVGEVDLPDLGTVTAGKGFYFI